MSESDCKFGKKEMTKAIRRRKPEKRETFKGRFFAHFLEFGVKKGLIVSSA